MRFFQFVRPLVWLVASFSAAPRVQGQFSFDVAAATSSQARLVAEVKSIAPGVPFSVALELEHPKAWHSYYRNSGGVELPPAIAWTLPAGFSAGEIQWPVPKVKDGYSGKSFIYEGSPVFLVEITPPDALVPGQSVTLTAAAAWQICEEACLNEEKTLSLSLPVAATAEPDPAAAALFARARASQPAEPAGWKFHATDRGTEIVLRVEAEAADAEFTDFVPDQPFVKSAGDGGSIAREGDAWVGSYTELETRILEKALERASGNKSEAARALGLKRTTFLDKLRRAGLERPTTPPPADPDA